MISRRYLLRHLVLLVTLMAGSAADVLGAATKNVEAATEIRAVMSAQVAAWNRGDIDGFMEG